MRTKALVTAALGIAVLLPSLFSSATGVFPGNAFALVAPSCGQCHGAAGLPGGSGLQVAMVPTPRSLQPGQAISVTVSATGGAMNPLFEGGLAGFVSRGTFQAGANTQVGFLGNDISHVSSNNNRSWTFGYTASTNRTGLVELYVVVNTVDGDTLASIGDVWGFHGFDASSLISTPVRMYVNATGVKPFGAACAGSFGNYPVFGASQSPTVGNPLFTLDVFGAAPATQVAVAIGANPSFQPIDLTVIGATGCTLYVDVLATVAVTTSPGDAQRGEGNVQLPLPIPNTAALIGGTLEAQAVIVDLASGRAIPITTTNALSITIQ